MKNETRNLIGRFIISALIASTLATANGCGRGAAVLTDPLANVADGQNGATDPGTTTDPGTDTGYTPGDTNSDGYSDLPQNPVDTPEPLPAPTTPVQPGQTMILRAIPTTLHAMFGKVEFKYVYTHLTWQPVNGATQYWIYRDTLPMFSEATKNNAYAVIKSGSLLSGYYDGALPPNMLTGSIGQTLKNLFKAVTNLPGSSHNFKVIAADATGNVLGESSPVKASSLPLLPLPKLNVPTTDTTAPLFTWADANISTGIQPDGYYVYVYPAVMSGVQFTMPTSFALWGTYRDAMNKLARYGDTADNVTTYMGTLPFNITFALKPAASYSWTVVSTKTDTGNMKTASSISKAWNGFGNFTIKSTAAVSASRYTATNLKRTTTTAKTNTATTRTNTTAQKTTTYTPIYR